MMKRLGCFCKFVGFWLAGVLNAEGRSSWIRGYGVGEADSMTIFQM
jgi:hypothetical protein